MEDKRESYQPDGKYSIVAYCPICKRYRPCDYRPPKMTCKSGHLTTTEKPTVVRIYPSRFREF